MIVITTVDSLPELCYDCPCHDGERGYCQADKAHRYSDYRPYWCPLKEQKVVEPKTLEHKDGWIEYYCGNCKTYLLQNNAEIRSIIERPKYCSKCGNEVKWDDKSRSH